MNSRSLLILATAALLIAGAVIAYLNMQPAPGPLPGPLAATPAPAPVAQATPAPSASTPPQSVAQVAQPPVSATPSPVKPTVTPAPIPEWDAKIDSVLKMNVGSPEMAQMLINMLPTLPPEGQAEAAQHISNLIDNNKDYARVMPLLKNPNLPEEVQDVLVTDLMNRDDAVKLPALLDIAKIPTHPYHDEALTDLQIFLDADNGQDWGKWDSAVKQYLKKQAAENADTAQ